MGADSSIDPACYGAEETLSCHRVTAVRLEERSTVGENG